MGSQHSQPGWPMLAEPLGFWSVDARTRRTKLDPSMSALFGLEAAEGARGLEQERLMDPIHPDDRPRASRSLDDAFEAGGSFSYRYRLRGDDGAFRWVQALGRRFTDEAGRPTHVSGILTAPAQPPTRPVEIETIEALMAAHGFAVLTPDPMLPRLIEAVLLHAGREVARGVDPSSLA